MRAAIPVDRAGRIETRARDALCVLVRGRADVARRRCDRPPATLSDRGEARRLGARMERGGECLRANCIIGIQRRRLITKERRPRSRAFPRERAHSPAAPSQVPPRICCCSVALLCPTHSVKTHPAGLYVPISRACTSPATPALTVSAVRLRPAKSQHVREKKRSPPPAARGAGADYVLDTGSAVDRCGIFAAHAYSPKELPEFRARAVALSKRLRHRGPDWSGCKMTDDAILVHERLAIVGVGELLPTALSPAGNRGPNSGGTPVRRSLGPYMTGHRRSFSSPVQRRKRMPS